MTQQEFFNRYSYNVRTDKIGGGSFGTVYKAYDNVLDRTVAIKVSEVKVLGGKEFSLLDEFDAIKDLPLHPNIANYEALHNFEQANGIFDYAVLQYYPDGNLKDLIKKAELTQEEKENAALHILAGLEFLHNHRVVHRDMKPSNILIQARNQGDKTIYVPKITDFGLSKKADPSAKSRFTNSFGGGTLEYSSPEQLRGQNLRFNTDLWAWAVITYELFTGLPMFKSGGGGSDSAEAEKMIFDQILNSELDGKLSNFPENWKRALMACFDRNPETRVKSAEDIRAILNNTAPQAIVPPVAPVAETPAQVVTPAPQAPIEAPEFEAATRIDVVHQEPEPQAAPQASQKVETKQAPANNESKKSKAPLFIAIGLGAAAIIGVALFFILKPAAEQTAALIVKQENQLFGYVDADSSWLIEPRFLSAEPFENGRAKVRSNDSLYYIDETGKMVEFIALVTIDPVDVAPLKGDTVLVAENPSTNPSTKPDDTWKADFEKKYKQLLDSEKKRTDAQNLKEYQALLKTIPSTGTAERNKVNSRIKFFTEKINNSNQPINNSSATLYGLKDIYNDVYDYVGEVLNGKPHGRGTATFKNGIKYVGDFKNGMRDGQGTLTYTNGTKFVGAFRDDKITGKGTMSYANGEKYVGDWSENYMHGSGTYTYRDGARYEGQFKKDKKHGWGKYYSASGALEYEGRYEDDKRLF
jgi:serine/threonine protein kinase